MNERLNRLSFTSWPIWLKLLLGFFVAVIAPLLMMVAIFQSTIHEVSRENVQNYVNESGVRQLSVINNALRQANVILDDFLADGAAQDAILALLPRDPGTVVDPIVKVEFTRSLQNVLLQGQRVPFEKVELVNTAGRLVARALPNQEPALAVSEDLSNTSAFQAASNADLVGRSEDLSISVQDGQLVMELVHLIGRGGSTAGYLVARLDVDHFIYENLAIGSEFFKAMNYLVSPAGIVITADGARTVALGYAEQLMTGTASLLNEDPNDIVRYQAQTMDVPFVLVNEASAEGISASFGRILITRGFVLLLGVGGLLLVLVLGGNQLITPPLTRIRSAIRAMASGNYNEPVPDIHRGDEIGQLAGSFADMRQQVQTLIRDLESRVEARTRDISATQDISNYAATQRDLQTLMNQVVNLITDRFSNIYHAQIFLVDSERRFAVLRASTGAPGQRLLEAGHRLGVGSVSVIGQVTEVGEPVIARDTGESRIHRRNEFLPNTRAELAIPLRNANGQVIGALDVQSTSSDSFDEDQVNVLQTMADQISVAIENARLYEESLHRLREIERSRRAATLGAWREQMRLARTQSKQSLVGLLPAEAAEISALRQQAIESGQSVVGQPTPRRTIPIAVPIRLRNQILGAVEWELPQANFDQSKLQLAETLVNRLAIGLENARLFQESQRSADRERLVNEIAGRLTAQTDVNQILQTAVREVGQVLRAPQVSIRIGGDILAKNDSNDSHEHATNGKGHNGNGHQGNGQS